MPSADRTTAARLLDLFGAAGVSTVFGLPGVHNLAFWSASPGGRRPRILSVRHEQAGAYAADGLARATGGLGIALTTTGPGAANTLAGFGEAASCRSPVLVVASEAPLAVRRSGIGWGGLHEMPDQGALFEPLAKAVFRATGPDEALAMAADAIYAARTAPAGPVYLGIPADVLAAEAGDPPTVRPVVPQPPELRALDAAAAQLGRAERVVIWAGGGCVAAGGERAVTDLAWRLGSPVVTTYAARGLLGVDHPLLVDAPPHEPEVAALIESADLMLVLGSQLDAMATRNWTMPRPAALIRVDADQRTAAQGWPADCTVVGDAALVADALATRVAPRDPWGDQVFRISHDVRAGVVADPSTAEAAALLESIELGWPSGADVICDMAVAGYWVGGYAAMPRTRRLQYPVGWGTLGFALPASIGATAGSGRRALVVAGDGGIPFAVGELATLAQEQLPVTVLVVDDDGYGMLRYDQSNRGDQPRGVDLRGPDWVQLAASFGIPGLAVSSVGEPLRTALAEAAEADGPQVLTVRAALRPPRTTSPRWHEAQ